MRGRFSHNVALECLSSGSNPIRCPEGVTNPIAEEGYMAARPMTEPMKQADERRLKHERDMAIVRTMTPREKLHALSVLHTSGVRLMEMGERYRRTRA